MAVRFFLSTAQHRADPPIFLKKLSHISSELLMMMNAKLLMMMKTNDGKQDGRADAPGWDALSIFPGKIKDNCTLGTWRLQIFRFSSFC